MLGRRGSKSEMSSGSQEGCCSGACTGPQCAWQECIAIANACSAPRSRVITCTGNSWAFTAYTSGHKLAQHERLASLPSIKQCLKDI